MARLGAVAVVAFLAAAVVAAEGILDLTDFLALQAVRRSLYDMPGSAFFDGWDFTADPCGFPGVYCDGNRVSALALCDPRAGSPGLTGRLDPALGQERIENRGEVAAVGGLRHAEVFRRAPERDEVARVDGEGDAVADFGLASSGVESGDPAESGSFISPGMGGDSSEIPSSAACARAYA